MSVGLTEMEGNIEGFLRSDRVGKQVDSQNNNMRHMTRKQQYC